MDILVQRINYANIELIKNYCQIQKRILQTTPVYDLDDVFSYNPPVKSYIDDSHKIEYLNMSPKKEKGPQTRFFYTKESGQFPFNKVFKSEDGYDTTNDRHIKKYFLNPFARIRIVTQERSIRIKDDKLIVKSYKQVRYRDYNCKYFKKNSNSTVLSFNLKTGNIIYGESSVTKVGKSKRFRQNSFSLIMESLYKAGFTKISNDTFKKTSKIHDEYVEKMDDTIFLRTMFEQLGCDLPENLKLNILTQSECRLFLMQKVLDFFIKTKKIKTPNDFQTLLFRYYPGEKFLKKNERKLVQAVADSFGIKNKSTIKLLHENVRLDIVSYKDFSRYFGEKFPKYFSSLNNEAKSIFFLTEEELKSTQQFSAVPIQERNKVDLRSHLVDDLTKENIIKVLNDLKNQTRISSLFSLIRDHIDMIERINEFDPNIRWRSTTYSDFHNEHMELTKIISLMKKGWTTEYVFDNRMVRKVEEPITVLGDDMVTRVFKPQILKREEEYAEEGAFMHHCVAGYSNKESSMIISLRLNNGLERVTTEYEKKTGRCQQERYFCNKVPPEYFKRALEILSERVQKFSYQRLLNHIEIKKVRVKINGIEVPLPPHQQPDLFQLLHEAEMNELL